MDDADAAVVADWHYEPPYDYYDFRKDPEDLAELFDADVREGDYHSVYRDGELVGFFSFKVHDDVVEIGLGLRPDLTGAGLGSSFVQAGLDHAAKAFRPRELMLDVALFNERARKVYERAGFRATHEWTNTSGGRVVPFLQMRREAGATEGRTT
jgi:ribosomal-protein-alanine N-acetyltransferase